MSRESNGLCILWVGSTYTDYMLGNTKSPQETIEKGIELAQKALAVDDSIARPTPYCVSSIMQKGI